MTPARFSWPLAVLMLLLGGENTFAKPAKLNSSFVSQSVPSTLAPGQTVNVSITMLNTGGKTWTPGAVQLGSQKPQNNRTWGLTRVNLPTTVVRGVTATFNFNITAPGTPGNYNFQWKMITGSKWFGQLTINKVISVTVAPPSPTPTPTPTPTPPPPTPTPTPTPTPLPPTPTPTPTPGSTATPTPGAYTTYIAHLRAQSVGSAGSGTAILRLAADEQSAIVGFTYSNLSSPVNAKHVHGPASPGQSAGILLDLDTAPRRPDGTYTWTFVPVGINTVADIVNAIKTGHTYLNVHTTNNPTGEILGFFNLATAAQSVPIPTPPPALPGGTPTAEDASRFLHHCTFGGSPAQVQHVQQVGFNAYLNEQFAVPPTSHLALFDAQTDPGQHEFMNGWWTIAITAPDQVRQRIAFALSQILVVSFENGNLNEHPESIAAYADILVNDSLGNYRQLLQDITLSPTMGVYLDMLRSRKANPNNGSHPNENYPRELMQLFSIGLFKLNIDGSLSLDAEGSPIPTYDQSAVEGLAAALTSWTFAGSTSFWDGTPNYRQQMMSFPNLHSPEAKTILGGAVIPAAQTPQQDMQQALDVIFNHQNVGRFIGRELIQRLVTSNPSPGYIYRVGQAFDNNGQGVRGDMKAVIRAILLDYDARGASKMDQAFGKLKEPVLRLTEFYRSVTATPEDGVYSFWLEDTFGQQPFDSPTVFNFYSPDYASPGAIAAAGLVSPEFQITTDTTVVEQANTMYAALFWGIVPYDLGPEETLADNPTALVDHLNVKLMNGAMSSGMRQIMIETITQLPSYDLKERALSAYWLVVNSPEYLVEK